MAAEQKTLEELAQQIPTDPRDVDIFARIVKLSNDFLPEGWKKWKAYRFSKQEILGEGDPRLLNKIRYALPTIGLIKAFDPEATHVSEKGYREIKTKMLDWPFCIGLIIKPANLASRIRGSSSCNELIVASLDRLKPYFLSQKAASQKLSEQNSDSDKEDEPIIRLRERGHVADPKAENNRLSKLEKSNEELKGMVQSLMTAFESIKGNILPSATASDSRSEGFSDTEDYDQNAGHMGSEDYVVNEEQDGGGIPPLLNFNLEEEGGEDNAELFEFVPNTKEQEPAVPPANPVIESQGIQCLRLGQLSYNKIRYIEAQKKLQAFPVFSALRVNKELSYASSSDQTQNLLTKADSNLAIILHGLLAQRDYFAEGMKSLISKHPSIKSDVQNIFNGPDSKFKQVSDDVVQFVCGKRAEVIEQRRKKFFPRNPQVVSLLEGIPPSSTHLFEEQRFSDVTRQHGSMFRTSFRKPLPGQVSQPFRKVSHSQQKATRPSNQSRGTSAKAHASYGNRREGARDAGIRKRKYQSREEQSFKKPKWQ